MRSIAIAAVATLIVVGASAQTTMAPAVDQCSQFKRCSECVYDAFPPQALKMLSCQWCEETSVCSSNITGCATVRKSTDKGYKCNDLQCSAARNTGNIYWCRANTIAAAVFSFELLLITVLYWFWLHAISQVPWKYPMIHQALDRLQAGNPGEEVELESRVRATSGACPICHVDYGKQYPPGYVCFWCDVARFAFIPFVIGLGASLVSILSLFSLSLRPSFADWYYAIMLAVPHAVYVAFGAWVLLTRRPVVGDEEKRKTTFTELAFELKGRPLSKVFQLSAGGAAEPTVKAEAQPEQSESTLSEQDQHVDTIQSLELDTNFPASFREALREALRSDEYIAWTEQPSSTVILVDNRWLLSAFGAGMFTGFYLVILSGIDTSSYPAALLAPGAMRAAGFIALAFNGILLALTISSIHRQYVLTNKRLIFLSAGLFSSTHFIATELADVKSASVHGYSELGYNVLRFTWGCAVKPTRRMPVVRPADFVGIVGLEELLTKFSEHAPALDSSTLKGSMDQLRMTWRIHIGVLAFTASLAPIVLVAPRVLPSEMSLLALVIVWFICCVLAQRGWRVLSTTSAHLNLAKEWGRYSGFSLSRLMAPMSRVKSAAGKTKMVFRSVVRSESPTTQATAAQKQSKQTEL
jgi:hypothetical protein